MNKQHLHKASAYSALAASFIALSDTASAQIVYTDVDPDINGDAYFNIYVDLDNNGVDDFRFTGGHGLWYNWIDVFELTTSAEVMGAYPYESWVGVLNEGHPITASGPFDNIHPMASVFDYYGIIIPVGDWLDATEKFVGVRILIDGNTHYGWVRLTTHIELEEPHAITFILHDYAIQMSPNTPLHAGDMDECIVPIPTGTSGITATKAKAKWGMVGGAEHFELRYKMTTAPDWNMINVPAAKTFKKLTGLNCSSEYEWQVRAVCDDGSETDYTASQLFNTAACRLDGSDPIETADAEIYTYSNQIYIDIFTDITTPAVFELFNMQGQRIMSESINENTVVISANVPDGIYIGTVHMNGTVISKKVVISR